MPDRAESLYMMVFRLMDVPGLALCIFRIGNLRRILNIQPHHLQQLGLAFRSDQTGRARSLIPEKLDEPHQFVRRPVEAVPVVACSLRADVIVAILDERLVRHSILVRFLQPECLEGKIDDRPTIVTRVQSPAFPQRRSLVSNFERTAPQLFKGCIAPGFKPLANFQQIRVAEKQYGNP